MDETILKLPETAQEVAETLADGTKIKVEFEPITQRPAEFVKVRRIPRAQFLEFADALVSDQTEIKVACIYVDRPSEWVESLTDDSLEAVLQEGKRLNFFRFEPWWERRLDVLRLAKVDSPVIQQALQTFANTTRKP